MFLALLTNSKPPMMNGSGCPFGPQQSRMTCTGFSTEQVLVSTRKDDFFPSSLSNHNSFTSLALSSGSLVNLHRSRGPIARIVGIVYDVDESSDSRPQTIVRWVVFEWDLAQTSYNSHRWHQPITTCSLVRPSLLIVVAF